MKLFKTRKDIIAATLLVVAITLRIIAASIFSYGTDISNISKRLSKTLEAKIYRLDSYMQEAIDQDNTDWINLKDEREEYIIYKYRQDTLQSWHNEFPVINDDIQSSFSVPYFLNPRRSQTSPLSDIGEEPEFTNLGDKWYITKSKSQGNTKIIGGFEIKGIAGPNKSIHLAKAFDLVPVSFDGGSIVEVFGKPICELVRQTNIQPNPLSAGIIWLSLILIISSALVFIASNRSLRRLLIGIAGIVGTITYFYFLGRITNDHSTLFSPILYTGSDFLYSLGAIIIVNLMILAICLSVYLCRDAICEKLRSNWSKILALLLTLLLSLLILSYTFIALRSVILNSGISLELYKISELSPFCIVVYLSFVSVLSSIVILLQSTRSISKDVLKISPNFFSVGSRVIAALLIAAFLISTAGTLGFRKEQRSLEGLAGRLAFERDIMLEMYLRNAETQIANDMVISALSVFNNTASSIRDRIADYYFARYDRNYSFSVFVFNHTNNSRAAADQYNSLVRFGEAISDNSHFLYVKKDNGQSYYVGVFLYLIDNMGVSRVLVRIDTKDSRDDKGYAGILGLSSSGRVSVPPGYSYAKYDGVELVSHRGNYAYPTKLQTSRAASIYEQKLKHSIVSEYQHFINLVGSEEAIVISRPIISAFNYGVAAILVALLAFLSLSIVLIGNKKEKTFSNSYFRSRISVVLVSSLLLTLLIVASVSVVFVYTKNESNNRSIMIDRISSIASMFELNQGNSETKPRAEWRSIQQTMNKISEETRSDITLYSPDGRLLMSTNPMVFEGDILSRRINGDAYKDLIFEHRRASIIRENFGRISYFNMYASILGSDGSIRAIVSSPYNINSFKFEEDAITHAASIVSIFIVFLLLAIFAVTRIVDRMFQPLSDMSLKMSKSDIESLEFVDYQREDEISSIVQAYNRMVRELILSSKKIAQAERDKAWSEMARQVAHEIKNPLTPMKLQIQRIQRLKDRNDPAWQERFDQTNALLLDHIEILTETANEFSSFAKLYSEEPSDIDLGKTLQNEISMFDSNSNIKFEYIGLEDVVIRGPKPQLTRVFVNLLNNSVQAIGSSENGLIRVSLRISSDENFYSIVFEDNGPGVDEDNISNLFVPNFTTKSGGSGLGLAISRSVLENCGATISYKRSFSLGGASFEIKYPKE